MPQGQVLEVLNRPLSQELLGSNIPTRLGYTERDERTPNCTGCA
jgi:hypothetical protein